MKLDPPEAARARRDRRLYACGAGCEIVTASNLDGLVCTAHRLSWVGALRVAA